MAKSKYVGVNVCLLAARTQSEPELMGVEEMIVAGKVCGYRVTLGQGNMRKHVRSFTAQSRHPRDRAEAYISACEYATIYNFL